MSITRHDAGMSGAAKYCCNCGKEKGGCECCCYETVTISMQVPRGVSPRIHICSDSCEKCGHTYSRCTCEGAIIDARLDRY